MDFLISETKLDDSFPTVQFQMKCFSVSYRYDRSGKGGGLLLYIGEDIQSKLLISKSKCNIETLSVAVNLRRKKWFLNCSYNHHQNLISNHLECLNRLFDEHSSSFDNFFIGNFNVSTNHNSIINFCDLNGLRNLINVPTCYKNLDNPASIDLILTNLSSYFQRSTVFETGLSDFHLHGVPYVLSQKLKRVFKNESLKLSNTVITKTLTTISSDLKYSSATLITLI